MIEVNNISYHYHGGKDVLKDVSFALEQGQFLAILGNNGVGKSTLLKCLNKILRAIPAKCFWMGRISCK